MPAFKQSVFVTCWYTRAVHWTSAYATTIKADAADTVQLKQLQW